MQGTYEPVDNEPVFVTQLVTMLNSVLRAEIGAKSELLDAKTAVSTMRDTILLQAHEDGTLDGEFREAKLLDGDISYQELLVRLRRIRYAAARAEVNCKTVKCRVGLMRAWLLSQCECSSPDVVGPVSPVMVIH